jgi:hypothetical protein
LKKVRRRISGQITVPLHKGAWICPGNSGATVHSARVMGKMRLTRPGTGPNGASYGQNAANSLRGGTNLGELLEIIEQLMGKAAFSGELLEKIE